jgi:hypothetical protein
MAKDRPVTHLQKRLGYLERVRVGTSPLTTTQNQGSHATPTTTSTFPQAAGADDSPPLGRNPTRDSG